MKNIEKYAVRILGNSINREMIGLKNNKPIACDELDCDECELCRQGCCYRRSEREYASYMRSWAATEYVERPKLTQKERKFCELAEGGWIARDSSGDVCWYLTKPSKGNKVWYRWCNSVNLTKLNSNLKFSFITWTDEEPWAVEDLLKLEVME